MAKTKSLNFQNKRQMKKNDACAPSATLEGDETTSTFLSSCGSCNSGCRHGGSRWAPRQCRTASEPGTSFRCPTADSTMKAMRGKEGGGGGTTSIWIYSLVFDLLTKHSHLWCTSVQSRTELFICLEKVVAGSHTSRIHVSWRQLDFHEITRERSANIFLLSTLILGQVHVAWRKLI